MTVDRKTGIAQLAPAAPGRGGGPARHVLALPQKPGRARDCRLALRSARRPITPILWW
ncbi:MAG: hypothetical protein WKG07_06005 [Hymenobacter sp.]